jgi:hypothetical protein
MVVMGLGGAGGIQCISAMAEIGAYLLMVILQICI